jgi:hypothetical protein
MYHHPDHALSTYHAEARDRHRTAAFERAGRTARPDQARPHVVRATRSLIRLVRLRLRIS